MTTGEPFKKRLMPIIHNADTHTERTQDGNVSRLKAVLTGLYITASSITKMGAKIIVSVLFNIVFPFIIYSELACNVGRCFRHLLAFHLPVMSALELSQE